MHIIVPQPERLCTGYRNGKLSCILCRTRAHHCAYCILATNDAAPSPGTRPNIKLYMSSTKLPWLYDSKIPWLTIGQLYKIYFKYNSQIYLNDYEWEHYQHRFTAHLDVVLLAWCPPTTCNFLHPCWQWQTLPCDMAMIWWLCRSQERHALYRIRWLSLMLTNRSKTSPKWPLYGHTRSYPSILKV